MAAQVEVKPLCHRGDRLLKPFVGERLHTAGAVIDEMVMVVVRIGDLVARNAVTAVEAVQQPELVKIVDDAVDRRCGANACRTQPIGDLLGAEQALALAREQLDDGGASGT